MVTNQLFCLNSVDRVILLKNGGIEATGSYDELMQSCSTFNELISNYMNQNEEDQTKPMNDKLEENVDDLVEDFDEEFRDISVVDEQLNKELITSCVRTISVSSVKSRSSLSLSKSITADKADQSKLVQAESIETGQISLAVYKKFISALSNKWAFLILINYFLVIASNTGSSFWLSAWTDSKDQSPERVKYSLAIYFVIGVMQAFFVCFGWLSIIFGTMRASRTLHSKLLSSILHAPMYFFDTTPLGRIINRFSRDIDILDVSVQFILR